MKKAAILAIALALTGCGGDKAASTQQAESTVFAQNKTKPLKIRKLIAKLHQRMLWLNNGRKYEIAPFVGNKFGHWKKDSEIEITKTDHHIYPVTIRNLDTDETVIARAR